MGKLCNCELSIVLLLLAKFLICVAISNKGWDNSSTYIYSYEAKTSLISNNNDQHSYMTKAEIKLMPYSTEPDGSVLIYLKILSADQKHIAKNGEDNKINLIENLTLSNWFSFSHAQNGLVNQVFYPKSENSYAINIKKAIVSTLTGILKEDTKKKTWKYNEVQDYDHTGQHDSSYLATSNIVTKKFTKIKTTIQKFDPKQTKEIYIYQKSNLIKESLTTDILTFMEESNSGELPQISANSFSKLSIITTKKLCKEEILQIPSDLVRDDIIINHGATNVEFDLPELKNEIDQTIDCLQKPEDKVRGHSKECFHKLVKLFKKLNQNSLEKITQYLFSCQIRFNYLWKTDILIDVIGIVAKENQFAQILLYRFFLFEDDYNKCPEENFAIRAIQHTFEFINPNEAIINFLEKLCRKESNKKYLEGKLIQQTSCLALGTVVKQISKSQPERALEIIKKLHSMIKIDDKYNRTNQSYTEKENLDHIDQAVIIDSLGNAGHEHSFSLTKSLATDNTTPSVIKRSAINSLRNYDTQEAAEILLIAAMITDQDHIRIEAIKQYQEHKFGEDINLIREEIYNLTQNKKINSIVSKSRMRREELMFELYDELEPIYSALNFKLYSPEYTKRDLVGNSDIGAEWGVAVQNGMELDIKMLRGDFRIDIHDDTYLQLKIKLAGIDKTIYRVKTCYIGDATYDFNIFQFSLDTLKEQTNSYNKVSKYIQNELSTTINQFSNNIDNYDIEMVTDSLKENVQNFPFIITELMMGREKPSVLYALEYETVRKLAFLFDSLQLVGVQLSEEITNSFLEIGDCFIIDVPYATVLIINSISMLKSSTNFLTTPLTNLTNIAENVLRIQDSVCVLNECKMKMDRLISKIGSSSTGFVGLAQEYILSSIQLKNYTEYTINYLEILRNLNCEPPKTYFMCNNDSYKNLEFNKATEGIQYFIDGVLNSSYSLNNLFVGFIDTYQAFVEVHTLLELEFGKLKRSYEIAKSLIEEIYGTLFHPSFLNRLRSFNGDPPDACGDGFYESPIIFGIDSLPPIRGIKILYPKGITVVAPFNGFYNYKSEINNSYIQIIPSGSLKKSIFRIYNVQPNDRVLSATGRLGVRLNSGNEMGKANKSPCTEKNFIFLVKMNRETLTTQDPTKHLYRLTQNVSEYMSECNDYFISLKGNTIMRGTLTDARKEISKRPTVTTNQDVNTSVKSLAAAAIEESESRESASNGYMKSYAPNQLKTVYNSDCDWCVNNAKCDTNFQTNFNKINYPQYSCYAGTNDLEFNSDISNYTVLESFTVNEILLLLNQIEKNPQASLLRSLIINLNISIESINSEVVHPYFVPTNFLIWQLSQFDQKVDIIQKHLVISQYKNYIEENGRCPSIRNQIAASYSNNYFCIISENCLHLKCSVVVRTDIFNSHKEYSVDFQPCGSEKGVTFKFGNEWTGTRNFDYLEYSVLEITDSFVDGGCLLELNFSVANMKLFGHLSISDGGNLLHYFCNGDHVLFDYITINYTNTCPETPSESVVSIGIVQQDYYSMTIQDLILYMQKINFNYNNLTAILYDLRIYYCEYLIASRVNFALNTNEKELDQFDYSLQKRTQISIIQTELLNYNIIFQAGPVPVNFDFIIGGYLNSDINADINLLSFTGELSVAPKFGIYVKGSLEASILSYDVGVTLNGDVCKMELPVVSLFNYNTFPLTIGSDIGLIIEPLKLELFAYVAINETTVYKNYIWKYDRRGVNIILLNASASESDATPPQFANVTNDANYNSKATVRSGGCTVTQQPNRDYTDPALILITEVSDDMSNVRLSYSIGSTFGGEDIIKGEYLHSNTIELPLYVPNSTPIYVTIYAANSQGNESIAICQLDNYDVTLPFGRILSNYIYTSHPHYFEVDVSVIENSNLLNQSYSLGYGPGIWGNQIIPFTEFSFKRNNSMDTTNILNTFYKEIDMKMIVVPFKSIQGVELIDCAEQCHLLRECYSFNFNNLRKQCEILNYIRAHNFPYNQFENVDYYEKFNIGIYARIVREDLNLSHNELYFYNVYIRNNLGYESILTSTGILTDFTPPSPGLIKNGIEEILTNDVCEASIPSVQRCYNSYSKLVHRVIRDGNGSATVFNGDAHGQENRYSITGSFIAANWQDFHDNETGIYAFAMKYGTEVCGSTGAAINPHMQYDSMEDWTYLGIITGLDLTPGNYYISIQAANNVVHGGAGVTTVCHTTSYVIDRDPPKINSIKSERIANSSNKYSVTVQVEDDLSHIYEIAYSIGFTKRDSDVLDWKPVSLPSYLLNIAVVNYTFDIDYEFTDGKFYIRIRVENNVGLQKVGVDDNQIVLDQSPPEAGIVRDGPESGTDLEYTSSQSMLCANWDGFVDPQSGINKYYIQFTTDSNGTNNISEEIDVGIAVSYCQSDLQLNNIRYYAFVTAENGDSSNDPKRTIVASNGVLVDLTDPIKGTVNDGLGSDSDMSYSADTSTVTANWLDFSDPESGIVKYRVTVNSTIVQPQYISIEDAIGTNITVYDANMLNYTLVQGPTDVGLDTSYTKYGFRFTHGEHVVVSLEAINGALLSTYARTTGVLIDTTSPKLIFIRDGPLIESDLQYQSSASSVTVSFSMVDIDSGIDHYEIKVYDYYRGERYMLSTPQITYTFTYYSGENGVSHEETIDGLTLLLGHRYHCEVKVFNQAGLYSEYTTNGVTIDYTAPIVSFVRINSPNQNLQLINGYVVTSVSDSISVYWSTSDPESGIIQLILKIGTCMNCSDVLLMNPTPSINNIRVQNIALNNSTLTNPIPYYVSLQSKNGNGNYSHILNASPLIVIEGDKPGVIIIGHSGLEEDSQYQFDTDVLTIHYNGFESAECGIRYYEWAVGTTAFSTDVMEFTSFGLVQINNTHGQAQGYLSLQHGMTYFATVRATTGCISINDPQRVIESSSSGIIIDTTDPMLDGEIVIDATSIGVKQLYSTTTDDVPLQWYANDDESGIRGYDVHVGSYPGGRDLYNIVDVPPSNTSFLSGTIIPNRNYSNFVTIVARNGADLYSRTTTLGLAIDTTVPDIGNFYCDKYLIAGSDTIHCDWYSVFDAESKITSYELSVGDSERSTSFYFKNNIDISVSSYTLTNINGSAGLSEGRYYVTFNVTNIIGLSSYISVIVIVDGTHPVASRISLVTNQPDSSIDPGCAPALNSISVFWAPFEDPESNIDFYLMGIGHTPGEFQLLPLKEVNYTGDIINVQGLDLEMFTALYVTVRAYNKAGLYTTLISAPIQTNNIELVQKDIKQFIFDGNQDDDIDFQKDLTTVNVRWQFSSRCPAVKHDWAIFLANGRILKDFSDIEGTATTTSDDGLALNSDQSFFVIVRRYDEVGFIQTQRSDGASIRIEPPDVGLVSDGLSPGRDFNYQISLDVISATWTEFGSNTTSQQISHYEVAIGTERGTIFGQTSVTPFRNVGIRLNITITGLTLTPSTIYYVTVKGVSVSNIESQASSNGITVLESNCNFMAGVIFVPTYQFSTTSIAVNWDSFTSCVPWETYQYALTANQPADPCIDINSDFSDNEEYIIPFTGTNNFETSATIFGIQLIHNKTYYVTVRAIDEVANCMYNTSTPILIDNTDPTIGTLNIGYDQQPHTFKIEPNAYFLDNSKTMFVRWEGFGDEESGLEYYHIYLYEGPKCPIVITPSDSNEDNFKEIANYDVRLETQYTFIAQSFKTDRVYYIKLLVVNKAGGFSTKWSSPIIIDLEATSTGDIRHGLTWDSPLTFQSSHQELTGTIAYLFTTLESAINAENNSTTEVTNSSSAQSSQYIFNGWTTKFSERLDAYPSFLFENMQAEPPYPSLSTIYLPERVMFSTDEVIIETTPDIEFNRMQTGAAISDASQLFQTDEWKIDIKASDNTDIITSVQLTTDRSSEYIQTYEALYINPITELGNRNNSEEGDSVSRVCIQRQGLLARSHPPACTEGNRRNEDSTNCVFLSPFQEEAKLKVPAVGFQLYKGDAEVKGRVLFWSRPDPLLSNQVQTWINLPFDPTQDYHTYGLKLNRRTIGDFTINIAYEISLIADRIEIGVLNEHPNFDPQNSAFLFHAWNINKTLLSYTDPLNLPKVYSYFKPVIVAEEVTQLQEEVKSQGVPFVHIQSPIIDFEVSVGTSPWSTDITEYTTVYKPCLPCNTICSIHYCNNSCFNLNNPITSNYLFANFSIKGLNLTLGNFKNLSNASTIIPVYYSNPQLNDNEILNNALQFIITRYYFNVRVVTGSGKILQGVSVGIHLDFTPPQCDTLLSHRDPAVSLFTPTGGEQVSSTSLAVVYNCEDIGSPIIANQVAIGTSNNTNDVMDYSNFPLSSTVVVKNLNLIRGQKYYMKVKITNQAGLSTNLTSPGVIIFGEEPLSDTIQFYSVGVLNNSNNNNQTEFGQIVTNEMVISLEKPNEFLSVSRQQNVVGAAWQYTGNTNIRKIYWKIGTSPQENELIGRLEVGDSVQSYAVIKNSTLFIGPARTANYSDLAIINNDCLVRRTDIFLETGRLIFIKFDLCSIDPICIPYNLMPILYIRPIDELISIHGRTDVVSFQFNFTNSMAISQSDSSSVRVRGDLYGIDSSNYSYLIAGPIYRSEWSINYGNGFSSYLPYIVDPLTTITNTTRYLRYRIQEFTDYSFFVAFANPLQNLTFSHVVFRILLDRSKYNTFDYDLSLISWNNELSAWQDLRELCSEPTFYIDIDTDELVSDYCYNYQIDSQNFKIQVALALIQKEIVNTAPIIVNNCFSVREGSTHVSYQLEHCDDEFDQINFSPIQSSSTGNRQRRQIGETRSTMQGSFTLTAGGLLNYTTCNLCSGNLNFTITYMEVGRIAELDLAITRTQNINTEIVNNNDPPQIAAIIDDIIITNTLLVHVVEGNVASRTLFFYENSTNNTQYNRTTVHIVKSYSIQLIAYDFDPNDNLTINRKISSNLIETESEIFDTLLISSAIRTVRNLIYTYTPISLNPADIVTPSTAITTTTTMATVNNSTQVNMTLENNTSSESAVPVLTNIIMRVHDRDLKYSPEVNITVLTLINPCYNNGTCKERSEFNTSCDSLKRINTFEYFDCKCPIGYTGRFCEFLMNDCLLNNNCSFNESCIPHFLGHTCFCGEDWLCQPSVDILPFILSVSLPVGSILFLIIIIIILLSIVMIFIVLRKRRRVAQKPGVKHTQSMEMRDVKIDESYVEGHIGHSQTHERLI